MTAFELAGAGQWVCPRVSPEVLAAGEALARRVTGLRRALAPTELNEGVEVPMRREGGTVARTRRPHSNEGPARSLPAIPKPSPGRVGAPPRPGIPTQHPDGGVRAAEGGGPDAATTVILPPPPAADVTQILPPPHIPERRRGEPDGGYPNRPDPTDAAAEVFALVERAQAGESAAFGLIYDRYVDMVFRFIYFRVGNRQLAEDLTSDTFLRALKRIGSFTWQGRDLGAWLVTIARNLVADHFKSGRYRLEVTTGDVLDADREDRGPEGSPEAAVVDHITNVALLRAVKQLNPEQQECIVLRFLQGFSVAETARAMGKNEGAIKALQYRAVRALARLLPEGFAP